MGVMNRSVCLSLLLAVVVVVLSASSGADASRSLLQGYQPKLSELGGGGANSTVTTEEYERCMRLPVMGTRPWFVCSTLQHLCTRAEVCSGCTCEWQGDVEDGFNFWGLPEALPACPAASCPNVSRGCLGICRSSWMALVPLGCTIICI